MDSYPPDVNPPEEMAAGPPPPQEADNYCAQNHDLPQNEVDLEEAPPLSPLLIEDTVIAVLSHVGSLEDLKSFRLVNSTWNSAATRALRSRPGGWIYFSTTQRTYEEMKALIEALDTSSWDFPWNKFHVDTSFHHLHPDWPNEKQDVVEQFFRAVAPFIKELKLIDSSRIGGSRLFPLARAPTDIHFPVLEKINFNLGRVERILGWDRTTYAEAVSSRILESNLHFIRSILSKAPRLKEVQSGDWRMSSDNSSLMSLDHLAKPLPKLTLYTILQLEPFQLLANVTAEHRLQLREFHLAIRYTHNDILPVGASEGLSRFLGLQSDSLEIVSLEAWDYWETTFRLTLPLLPKLRKLTSRCCLSLEHSYPALKELTLWNNNNTVFNFAAIHQPMESLTTLELPFPIDLSPAFFQNLARVMPNLRKLSVTQVWDRGEQKTVNLHDMAPLQNVVELSIPRGQGDLMLTGLSAEELALWKQYSAEELKMRIQTLGDPPLILQRLSKLKILPSWRWWPAYQISDLSWWMMLKLTRLTCLDLRRCNVEYAMSAQLLAEMRAKFYVLLPRN